MAETTVAVFHSKPWGETFKSQDITFLERWEERLADLVSQVLAPGLVVSGVETIRCVQGLCQLSCNSPSIASQGEGSLLRVPVPWGHISQDELDPLTPLGGLPKV